ncbi:NAD-dependent deacetylase [Promethearchaeum syntrophicum]|uniref:protein acetyllysine N-acetyltransferase n=1 Tax=Promethearchaeum syntrophicum TaxID=2594042 RepID=A0A5B9D9L3_9ARCH|nr:Sir2 family NAD-dependent protein deacetylase [Candidatus Prometheoarchaeum syntrophicum]QEE15889.1 NAD-dependent protein deacylase 2 [Candidatus Prometheoarchaeum syntrophicum]
MSKQKSSLEHRINTAAKWIAQSKYLVFFTGAGISTDSGIPDYRGPNGVWTRRDKGLPPPRMEKKISQMEPNDGHRIIKELQDMGLLKFLISQNIDNLHLKSGIHMKNIAELHGNRMLMRCLNCHKQFPKKGFWNVDKWGDPSRKSPVHPNQPKCPECNGRIINSVVNFGDPMPRNELETSFYHSSLSDVFVVVGSSLVVTPAALLPKEATNHGSKLIIINQMETPYDNITDLRFFENASEILKEILKKIKKF